MLFATANSFLNSGAGWSRYNNESLSGNSRLSPIHNAELFLKKTDDSASSWFLPQATTSKTSTTDLNPDLICFNQFGFVYLSPKGFNLFNGFGFWFS